MFHGPIRNRIALTEILLSPGGERLSPECAQICAVLLMAVDPSNLAHCYRPGGKREFDRDRDPIRALNKSVSHCHDVNQAIIKARGEDLKLRHKRERVMRRWILISNLASAVLGLLLVLMKFFR